MKLLKKSYKVFKKYYFLSILIFSVLLGTVLFYISGLRHKEVNISPVTIYCLETKDEKICRRRNLMGKELKNRHIEKIIFTQCFCKDLRLFNVKVNNADFREGHFGRASFSNVSLIRTNFFKSSFYGAILKDVIFEDSNLRGVVFNFAVLRNVQFKNVDMRSAVFIGTRFENVSYDKNTKWPFSIEQLKQMNLHIH